MDEYSVYFMEEVPPSSSVLIALLSMLGGAAVALSLMKVS